MMPSCCSYSTLADWGRDIMSLLTETYSYAPARRDAAYEPHCGGSKRRKAVFYRSRMRRETGCGCDGRFG
jgi:hypothetical protein